MGMHRLKTFGSVFLLTSVLLAGCLAAGATGAQVVADGDELVLTARARTEVTDDGVRFKVVYKRLTWAPSETAVIICDMWDRHWCKGATQRVAEMAPLMNEGVSRARTRGVLIIHAPSGTVGYYENHPARKRAVRAQRAPNVPDDIGNWCTWKSEREARAEYPIDQADGGCDCEPKCETGSPWRKQIETIEISDEDAISDSGLEIWNLLEQRRIRNVILMGVHTNMCVLGRPFGLRNMARYGRNVVLMRDMTDTMYNSRMRPFVNHFTGTDLIVEHIEKFVCPTVTSTELTGRAAFDFSEDKRPRVVFLSAESEYGAAESLPEFAHELQMKYGLHCDVLQGSTQKTGKDRHDIPGMETLANADLAVVFVRRRALPPEQMKRLRDYLSRGRPLIGLRTASHAFDAKGQGPSGYAEWLKFDADVLGGNYHGHYGRGPETTVAAERGAEGHPILEGVRLPLTSNASLYQTSPLADSTTPLLTGTISAQKPEPVAWTNSYGNSRVFYTSLGHRDDFANPQFRKLLVNAVFWAMNKAVPASPARSSN
jgi:type 1 glutamine amidotransferase/nicotinamidase-related amidase